MDDEDGDAFDDVGNEVAVPEVGWLPSCHDPKDRDDGEGEGKGDEQCHVVLLVELIHDHQHVDVAEGDEAEGKDA